MRFLHRLECMLACATHSQTTISVCTLHSIHQDSRVRVSDIPPACCVKSLRSSYTGVYPQILARGGPIPRLSF